MKKQSRLNKWLFGKEIPMKIGMFKDKNNNRVLPVITSSRICFGYVDEKQITFTDGEMLDHAYISNFSVSLIKDLQSKGLIFIEIL